MTQWNLSTQLYTYVHQLYQKKSNDNQYYDNYLCIVHYQLILTAERNPKQAHVTPTAALQPWLQPNLLMCWIPVPLQNVFLLQILMQSKEMKKTIHISLCSYFLISYNFSIFFLFFYYLNVSLSDFSGWLIYFQRNFHNCQVLYADCET